MLRLLFASAQPAQFLHRIEIPISMSALYFRVTFTNIAGQTATLREIGRLRFSIRQQPVVDADADYLSALANHWYGSNEFISTVALPFRWSCFIPRSFVGDSNVERVTKSDAAIFDTSFTSTLLGKVTAGTFLAELYAVSGEGPQSYNLLLFQQAYPTVAANSNFVDDLSSVENVCAAYISDVVTGVLTLAGSAIDRVRARKGDVTVDASRTALMAYTATKYNIEGAGDASTTQILGELFGMEGSDFSARLEDRYNLTVQTGATTATPQMLTVGMKPNPDRLGESTAEIQDRLSRAKRDKAASGKTRALSVIDATTG
jgi:hypothetical protein